MHANDIPQNITDTLRLCSKEDIELARRIIDLLVERNRRNWNDKFFV